MSPWRTVDGSSVVPDPTGRVVIRFVTISEADSVWETDESAGAAVGVGGEEMAAPRGAAIGGRGIVLGTYG